MWYNSRLEFLGLPVVANGVEVEPAQLDVHMPKNWIVVDLRARGTAYVNDAGPLRMFKEWRVKDLSQVVFDAV